MSEQIKKGGISVETRNIFPVIKKWLYSDKEIFIRELVSNACDAISKHKRLVSLSEAESSPVPYRIDVKLSKKARTITVCDNGIGMSEAELDKYINQIALSGALDFIEKYESASGDTSGIIGHFGLGFYSAFMICDKVEIITRSYKENTATHWTGKDTCEYEMTQTEKDSFGTEIILNVNEDEDEFLSETKIKDILKKFCSFMPYEIYFTNEDEPAKEDEKNEPINDTMPLWQKKPSECTKEEYCAFYKKVFNDYRDPLFYIHINADYPLNFKGILYFPALSHEYQTLEGQIKLYYNQVFVADNIKEVIPEYLLVLKGVLDCPELPLNVSRSYLQSNGYVNKISAHIVKKVADKLCSMFNLERENYEEIWNAIKPFVEYGCMRDDKFYSKVKDVLLFRTTAQKYTTLNEYTKDTEKSLKNIYYTTDEILQSRYISMFKNEGVDVLVFDKMIDTQFISFLEHKMSENDETKDTKLLRVDSGVADLLVENGDVADNEKLITQFKNAIANEKIKIKCELLKDENIPAILNISEEQRRFAEMMSIYGVNANEGMGAEETLVINLNCPTIKKLCALCDEESENAPLLAKHIYMLALISSRVLSADELAQFINSNINLIDKI